MDRICFYCERAFGDTLNTYKGMTTIKKTKDHVVPRSMGGSSNNDNIIYCCEQCNKFKGKRNLNQWRDMISDALANIDPVQGIVMKKEYTWRITQYKIATLRTILFNIEKFLNK